MSTATTLPKLFITGITGFLGAHILDQAVEAGYPVRVSVREKKVAQIRELYGDRVEVVVVNDIATESFVDALRGIDVLIHTAARLPGKETRESVISAAVDGTLNVLQQAVTAGVKRVVATASVSSAWNIKRLDVGWTNHVYTDNEWSIVTKEDLAEPEKLHPFMVYMMSKILAELELWNFADAHPEIDFTTLNPPFIYGPLANVNVIPKGQYTGMSTFGIFFKKVFAGKDVKMDVEQKDMIAQTIDVRDLARAHILAAHSPLSTEPGIGRKRILIDGPNFTFASAAKHLRNARPELADRISDPSDAKPQTIAGVDNGRLQEILKFGEFIPWEKTVEDMADSIIAMEKAWEA